MKKRITAIALGVGAATAAGLSLLKVDKPIIVGSAAVVVAGGLMIAGRDKEDSPLWVSHLQGLVAIGLDSQIRKVIVLDTGQDQKTTQTNSATQSSELH